MPSLIEMAFFGFAAFSINLATKQLFFRGLWLYGARLCLSPVICYWPPFLLQSTSSWSPRSWKSKRIYVCSNPDSTFLWIFVIQDPDANPWSLFLIWVPNLDPIGLVNSLTSIWYHPHKNSMATGISNSYNFQHRMCSGSRQNFHICKKNLSEPRKQHGLRH